ARPPFYGLQGGGDVPVTPQHLIEEAFCKEACASDARLCSRDLYGATLASSGAGAGAGAGFGDGTGEIDPAKQRQFAERMGTEERRNKDAELLARSAEIERKLEDARLFHRRAGGTKARHPPGYESF